MARIGYAPVMNRVHPHKLLLSKWTAVEPKNREKHFLVVEVEQPEQEGGPILWVVLEAVLTRGRQRLAWRELKDSTRWRQGWV